MGEFAKATHIVSNIIGTSSETLSGDWDVLFCVHGRLCSAAVISKPYDKIGEFDMDVWHYQFLSPLLWCFWWWLSLLTLQDLWLNSRTKSY